MSVHKVLGSLLVAIGLSVTSLSYGGGNPEDINELRKLLQPISSLSARFEQRVTDSGGFQLQETSGTFLVARPGKIRWISEAPMKQEVVSNGTTLWIYDPDLEQVTVQPFDPDIAATPAVLFSDDLDKLDRAFFVSRQTSGKIDEFELKPEQGGSLFANIVLQFQGGTPAGMILMDTLGQRTSIRFEKPVINAPASDAQFVFEIPDGVDVIRNER